MNIRFVAIALLFITTGAVAQEAASDLSSSVKSAALSRHQDISVFVQNGSALQAEGESFFQGLIFRRTRRANPQIFWKIGLGFGSSFASNYGYSLPPVADTSYTVFYQTRQRAVQVLAGVETERKLWKGVFLTAGLEGQAGGGKGSVDSSTHITFAPSGGLSAVSNFPSQFADVHTYFGAGLGSIGLRAYKGRFTAALDILAGVTVSMRSQTILRAVVDAPRDFSIFNFDLLGTSPRLSLGYRF